MEVVLAGESGHNLYRLSVVVQVFAVTGREDTLKAWEVDTTFKSAASTLTFISAENCVRNSITLLLI